MGIEADCVRSVKDSIAKLGGLDVIISNAVWSPFTYILFWALIPSQGYTRFSNFSDRKSPSKCIFFSSSLFRDNCLYILILGISSNNSYILEDALWNWGIDNSDFLQSALQRLKTGILASPST